MKISDKDKKLLVYLLAFGIIAAAYFFVAKPLLDKQLALSDEVDSLQQKVNHCNDIYARSGEYEGMIVEAQTEYSEISGKFFGGLDQENVIIMVKSLEDNTNVWISRIGFSETEVLVGGDGQQTEEEPAEDSENSDALTGLRQDLSIEYSAKYDDFKKFVEYVQTYDKRLYISNMSCSYAEDTNRVSGSITLSQFALKGADGEYTAPDLASIETGVDNIFSSLNKPSMDNMAIMQTLDNPEESADGENAEETAEEGSEENSEENKEDNKSEAVEEPRQQEAPVESEPVQLGDDPGNSGRRRPGA